MAQTKSTSAKGTRPASRSKVASPAPFLERTPVLEWITAGLGLCAALGAIGFLTWEGLSTHETSPVLTVAAQRVTPTAHGHLVEVEVRNQSHVTASAVQVEGVLPAGDGPEETVSLTFDYVPGLGRREGSMAFTRDPRGQPLELKVRGQVDP